MIESIEKCKCTGCKLCADVCPQSAIYYENDAYGFWYPKVNKELCTECGLCKKKCPSLNKEFYKENNDPVVYAAWSKDCEVRYNSTSGGVFWEIAKAFLMEGGVAAGCKWGSDWKSAEHIIAYSVEELEQLRGSKYIQSDTAGIYKKVKRELCNGKKVLFCGTPCQNAAMKMYIGDAENIYYFDFICRSINSPLAFRAYIDELEEKYESKVESVRLREKRKGWLQSASYVVFENGKEMIKTKSEDVWFAGFVGADLYTRDCCFECQYRVLEKVVADVTVGDFWGVQGESEYDMFRGISVVLVNTPKGKRMWDRVSENLFYKQKNIEDALKKNFAMLKNPKGIGKRDTFFEAISITRFTKSVEKCIGKSIVMNTKKAIYQELEEDKQKYKNKGIINEELYIELNYSNPCVVHIGKGKLIPYINSVIDLQKTSQIIVHADNDFEIGTNLFRGSKIETLIRMGKDAKWYIYHGGYLAYGTTVDIEDNAVFETGYFSADTGSTIITSKKIVFGDDVLLGRNVMICDNDFHKVFDENLNIINSPQEIIIEDHVWLTANINVSRGVRIGQGSIIDNQMMVNRNVSKYSFVSRCGQHQIHNENIYWSREPLSKYEQEKLNKKIILYGYGITGRKFQERYFDKIEYIIDNFVKDDEVWKFNDFYVGHMGMDMKNYIWVIASPNYYEKLYTQIRKCYRDVLVIPSDQY